MSSGTVTQERDGHIATVTLSAPERLNALNLAMWRRLGEIFAELNRDHSVRCIVLRGDGARAFAAGADIAEFEHERHDVASAREYGRHIGGAVETVSACPHPVVALIQGVCVGGGLELACCCDMRICGESSRFGVPVKNLGLVVALNEMEAVARVAGYNGALEIVLEGRVFGAGEARAMGLVNRVVADDKVVEESYACARRVAEGAPLVARWHKKFARRLLQAAPLTPEEVDESYQCFATEDFQTGYRAFLAKQKPEFHGR